MPMADIVVESDEGPHDAVVKRIISALQNNGELSANGEQLMVDRARQTWRTLL